MELCPICETRPQVERGNMCENLCDDCFIAIPESALDAELERKPDIVKMNITRLDLENEITRALAAPARLVSRVDVDTLRTLEEIAETMNLADGLLPTREKAIDFVREHIRDCMENGLKARETSFLISPLAMISHLDLEFGRAYEIAAELLDSAVESESEVLP